MRRFVLEGSRIRSGGDFHEHLQKLLGFFEGYGRNLDALNDVLNDGGGLMKETPPFEVLWKDSGTSRDILGDRFQRIVEVFRDSPVRLVFG